MNKRIFLSKKCKKPLRSLVPLFHHTPLIRLPIPFCRNKTKSPCEIVLVLISMKHAYQQI